MFYAPYVTVNDLAVQAEALRDVERRQVKMYQAWSSHLSFDAKRKVFPLCHVSQDVATMYFESHQNQGFLVVVEKEI